jgi:hypothetical protein
VKGGLASPPDAQEPSEEEEERRAGVIHQTCQAVADQITYSELNQPPGFSSVLEFLWVRDPDAAYARLRELLVAGGTDTSTTISDLLSDALRDATQKADS